MQNALLVGLSRQVALGRELDVVANNIANINTSGFKGSGALFEEYLAPTARIADASVGSRRVSYVRDRATWMDLSQGPIEKTGNPLDVAVDGKGYLAVQTQGGERYTRNGALQVNAAGELVTAEGYVVLGENGPIQMQPKDRDITISPDGTISAREGNVANLEARRGRLRLVRFDQPTKLRKDGGSTYAAPEGVVPQADTVSRVVQGAIEKSNVKAVAEMSRLIEVTRSYTNVASMLNQQGDLTRTAIEKLAEVPA